MFLFIARARAIGNLRKCDPLAVGSTCKQEYRLGLDRACLVLSRGGTCTAKVPYSPCKECVAIRGNSSKSNKYIDLRIKPRLLSV